MARDKNDPRFDAALRLEEVVPEAAPVRNEPAAMPAPLIELLMEQAAVELGALPLRAQLAVLRALVPSVLDALDAEDRAYWARALVGDAAEHRLS